MNYQCVTAKELRKLADVMDGLDAIRSGVIEPAHFDCSDDWGGVYVWRDDTNVLQVGVLTEWVER